VVRLKPVKPGDRFNRVTVIHEMPRDNGSRVVLGQCDCGVVKKFHLNGLRKNNPRSCGCLRRETTARKNKTHGMSARPEYVHWKAMQQRCNNPNHHKYSRYGGRGIRVDVRWESFEKFMEDVGPAPGPEYSIDRYPDRNGNYQPGNVRWATPSQQTRNRDCTRTYNVGGIEVPVIELSELCGIPTGTLIRRLSTGWGLLEAMATPSGKGNNQWTRRKR